MRLVDQTPIPPQTCAVLPHRHFSERFIDTGTDLPGVDPHIYVSESAVGEMARIFGWRSPADSAATDEAIEGLEAQLAELETECNRLQAQFDAIDVLGSAGFTARRKPGPKKSEAKAA
jgi:hypothetical protein